MSAICGFAWQGPEPPSLGPLFKAMPQYGAASADWSSGKVGLGSRHDAAGTLRGGGLARDAERGIVVAATARLDDRSGLCAALDIRPAERSAVTDADLVLRAWIRWGRESPSHLLGDFSFAVWDERRRALFCARDPVGVRPFYYAATPSGFVFASAVEALLAAGVDDALDESTVAAYLTRVRPRSGEATFFNAIRSLLPGHALAVEAGRLRIARYWLPEDVPPLPPASGDAYAEELLRLYRQAVDDRVADSDAVGVHLSGGLDSSSVAVLAAQSARARGRPSPTAFTWLPDANSAVRRKAPEYRRTDAVCKQEDLPLRHQPLTPSDLLAMLRRDGALPGVQAHPGEEPVQRAAAAEGINVMLTGSGGDEGVSFNGDGHDAWLLLTGRWARWLRECRARRVAPTVMFRDAVGPLKHWANEVQWWLRDDTAIREGWLIAPDLARQRRPRPHRYHLNERGLGMRRTQLHLLRLGHLNHRLEGWAASGAARGIDYRHPLLDKRLLEFALGLPTEQFRHGLWRRWIMRWALRDTLPIEVAWNQHKGEAMRRKNLFKIYEGARPALRQELAHATPSRARFVDMPRLRHRLRDDQSLRDSNVMHPRAALHNALQFLDF